MNGECPKGSFRRGRADFFRIQVRRIEGSHLNSSTLLLQKNVAQNIKEIKKHYIEFEKHIKELSSTLKEGSENITKTQQTVLFSSSGERSLYNFILGLFKKSS